MPSTDDLINELEHAIHKLLDVNSRLRDENHELKSNVSDLKDSLDSKNREVKILEDKYKELKIVSALSGNSEHKRLMKHKLNGLIKEVDMCIAEVKKKSI